MREGIFSAHNRMQPSDPCPPSKKMKSNAKRLHPRIKAAKLQFAFIRKGSSHR